MTKIPGGHHVASGDAPFEERFATRSQAEWYRDRFKKGRRAQTHQRECAALREVLRTTGRVSAALDLPCGTGRLSGILAEASDRIVLADSSPAMLDVARGEFSHSAAEYLHTKAESINLPDRSVYLVFSHRFLSHVNDAALRRHILSEFRRVTERYVLLSYYPPSLRSRLRWSIRCLLRRAERRAVVTTTRQFLEEVTGCGLRLAGRTVIRRFPSGGFFLFERVDDRSWSGGDPGGPGRARNSRGMPASAATQPAAGDERSR